MKSWWFYFECLGCPFDTVVDVRVDVKDEELPVTERALVRARQCPMCLGNMTYRGRNEANADGYKPAKE